MSVFLAVPIPTRWQESLQVAAAHYPQYVARLFPPQQWHLTVLWLGQMDLTALPLDRLTQPLTQAFTPTVTLTHVGRGRARSQLWAYAQPTPTLLNLHDALKRRVKSMGIPLPPDATWVPHVHVANFFDLVQGLGVPDMRCLATFAPRCVNVYRSEQGTYYLEGIISLC